jgi:hypothetical protein
MKTADYAPKGDENEIMADLKRSISRAGITPREARMLNDIISQIENSLGERNNKLFPWNGGSLKAASVGVALLRSLPLVSQIQSFDFFSGPGGSSQKLQTGFDTRVIIKTPYADESPHLIPAIMFHQLDQYLFQRDPVKRIFEFLISHVSTRLRDTSFFQRRVSLRLLKIERPLLDSAHGLSAKVLVD